jgi:integrase
VGDGLYLTIDPAGSKYWVLRIMAHGKRHDYGLGATRFVPLADAREKALSYRRALMAGSDPLASKRNAKAETPTFREAAKKCMAEHEKGLTSKAHKAQWANSLTAHAYPMLGNLPADKIDTRDVLRAITPIWQTKPEVARRVLQRIGKILNWATLHGHRSGDNPVDVIIKGNGLPPQNVATHHHAALPHAKVRKFIERLQSSTAEPVTRLAFEFLVLTACRTHEVVGARWDEIDLGARTWTIPVERLKVKKGGRPHIVPLSDRALAVLAEARTLSNGTYVFPSPKKPGQPLSTCAFRNRIKYMGLSDVTGHGFRSSFRDWATEQMTFSHEAIEAALAHAVKNTVEAAYKRTNMLEARQRLMQAWSDYVTGRASPDNVVKMPARSLA